MQPSTHVSVISRSNPDTVWPRLGLAGRIGLFIVVAYVLTAACAPVIAPHDPLQIFPGQLRQAPGPPFPLGTDEVGRDIWSRLLFGARASIRVSLISVAIASAGGRLLGLVAGYAGAWTDLLAMRLVDILLAFPGILLAIGIVSVLGPGLGNVTIAVGIEAMPAYARGVRASMLSVRERDFVLAARALGAPPDHIVAHHILPNVLGPVLVLATLGVGLAILTAASLSFIGIGARPPLPEWGSMLATARGYLRESPWIAAFPGLCLVLLVLGMNLLGEGLRDALDPRLIRTLTR